MSAYSKSDWIWMPHAAHFICGPNCRFVLATYVGGYIVSTVGEHLPDETGREISAKVRGIKLEGMGDDRLADYMKKLGYQELGFDRLYETMVFPARPTGMEDEEDKGCCPWRAASWGELDFAGYKTAGEAMRGHMELCEKWAAVPEGSVTEESP